MELFLCVVFVLAVAVLAAMNMKPNPHVFCRQCKEKGTVTTFRKSGRAHGRCSKCNITYPL